MRPATEGALEVSPPLGRPHRSLAGLVGGYQGYHQLLPAPGVHRGLPSTVVTVVFAFDEPLDSGWLSAPEGRRAYWTLASGLHTQPAEIRHQGRQAGIQLSLTARGARAVLGIPMSALATEMVHLDDLLGSVAVDAREQMQEQSSWAGRYAVLDAMLRAQRSRHRSTVDQVGAGEVAWAWQSIQASHGSGRVDALARAVGWSRRHLANRFRAEYGLSPKQVARIARFERSRAGLSSDRGLAEVAAECGYADQAHLSREWRSMAGYSPREWQHLELPFLQDILTPRAESGGYD